MWFGSVIGFIDHLQIVTASNYNTLANSYTFQFTTAVTIIIFIIGGVGLSP
jgi:hypothetical protein